MTNESRVLTVVSSPYRRKNPLTSFDERAVHRSRTSSVQRRETTLCSGKCDVLLLLLIVVVIIIQSLRGRPIRPPRYLSAMRDSRSASPRVQSFGREIGNADAQGVTFLVVSIETAALVLFRREGYCRRDDTDEK